MSIYTTRTFRDRTGYLVGPDDAGHDLVTVRHSAMVKPWADGDVHCHQTAEEYYFLLHGRLGIWVAGQVFSLRPLEMLLVWPGVPHAVVRGEGRIEHFVLRAPAGEDRISEGKVPTKQSPGVEEERELREGWGYRLSVADVRNQNCWLFGIGQARFRTSYLVLAYLDFATMEEANAGIGTRHRLHLHRESWEYYLVLEGTKSLRVEDDVVMLSAGEMLEVPPGVRHTLHGRQAPYRGFTFRVPSLGYNDKIEC